MTAPLFYAQFDPSASTVTLTGDQARHAAGAVRLRAGEPVLVGDGRGTVATCTVLSCDRRAGVALSVEGVARVEPLRQVTVVQAAPKGDHADLAVDLLTQTGASAIVPWLSSRCVVDWRGKEQAKLRRWRAVARAAAQQSRRAHLPLITDVVRGLPTPEGRAFILHEDAEGSLFDAQVGQGPLTVVVGPEGGLTEEEVAALRSTGGTPVTLGRSILRSSAAGAAACVWIRGLENRGGVVT